MGLNAALYTAGRSLEVFSTGIQVAGQNIANANTPGYIREHIDLAPNLPYKTGGLTLGTGVFINGVRQEVDQFLEERIHVANSDAEVYQAREKIYQELETALQELGESDLSSDMSLFLASVNDLANQPESSPNRRLVIEEGEMLANEVSALRTRLDLLRTQESTNVEGLIAEANELIDVIYGLNREIPLLEAAGQLKSDAGGLRSQRYTALNRLSEIIPIRYQEHPSGSVDVFVGTDYLILGGERQHLQTEPVVDREVSVVNVTLTNTLTDVSRYGGELRGVIEGRDDVLGGFVDQLDQYSESLIYEFNKIHASGEGLIGFGSVTSDARVLSTTAALNTAASGLEFVPQHGSFQVKVTNSITGVTESSNITVDLDGIGADTTLASLQAALNGVSNVNASITTDLRLKLDAAANFDIRFSDDTSGALAALGINTFFTGSDSLNIGVNSTLKNDHRLLATGQGGGPADGRNAFELTTFVENPVSALGDVSLNAFYNGMVTSVAQNSASESALAEGFDGFRQSLFSQRDQISGVNLDEEAIDLMRFQRSYQSAARIISTVDELFGILLSM